HRQMGVTLQSTDVLHLFMQYPLFQRDLCSRMHMLHGATTTDPGVRARRCGPVVGGHQYLLRPQLIELAAAAGVNRTDGLARQCTLDEGDLAVDIGDAAAIMAKALNIYRHRLGWQFVTLSSGSFHVWDSGSELGDAVFQENTPVDR